jgi:hypothetical protein
MVENRLMEGLAPTTKHLLFVAGVPVIHPRLEFADKAMGWFGSKKDSMNKSANVYSSFLTFRNFPRQCPFWLVPLKERR